MGLFGNLFDFNRDGKTSFTEQMVGLGLAAGMLGLLEEEDHRQRELAIDIEIEEENALDAEEELYERLDELRDELSDLEWEEPDNISSEEYDEWDEKRQKLEEEIEKLEEKLGEGSLALVIQNCNLFCFRVTMRAPKNRSNHTIFLPLSRLVMTAKFAPYHHR